MRRFIAWSAPLVLLLGLASAARAQAGHDPRALAKDLRDQEVRLWDQYQRAGMTKWFYGRFRTRDDGSLWKDDKGLYEFSVDLNHPLQKNSPRTLRENPKDIDTIKFRQLPHQAHWKMFRTRFPSPKKPDRGAIAALAKEAIARAGKPEENWELFLDEIRNGLLDTAARIYEAVIEISPDWPTGYRDLADLYRERFDYENEMRTYQRARSNNALDEGVLRREGEAMARLGLTAEAERSFQEAIGLAPTDAASHLGLGKVRLAAGRPADAMASFEVASQGGVSIAGVALQGLGRCRLRLARTAADVEAAVKVLGQARDQATDEARGLDGGVLTKEIDHDLAVAMLLQGRFAEAEDAFVSLLELQELPSPPVVTVPDDAAAPPDGVEPAAAPEGPRLAQEFNPFKSRAYTNLGIACMRNEKHENARECFALAAALDPTSAEPWIALGALEEKVAAWWAAGQAYRAALTIDPTDAGAHYALGQLEFRAGKLDEAEKELEETIRYDPDMADALVLLGHVALRTQRDGAAARYFARAAEFLPEDASLHASRGVALLRQGDLAAADAAFQHAQEVDGKNVTAQEGLAWIAYARARGKREREGEAIGLMQQIGSPWATEAQQLIDLQRAKHQWTDPFDRADAKSAGNRWKHDLKNGPIVQLRGGRAVLAGPVKKDPTQPAVELVRDTDRDAFVAAEARLWAEADKPFAARLVLLARNRRDENLDALYFGKSAEGQLVIGHYDAGEKRWVDLQTLGAWPVGDDDGAVALGIERLMEGTRFVDRYRFSVNGEVVVPELEVPFRASSRDMAVGVQGAANLNAAIQIEVDDVRIIEKRSR